MLTKLLLSSVLGAALIMPAATGVFSSAKAATGCTCSVCKCADCEACCGENGCGSECCEALGCCQK